MGTQLHNCWHVICGFGFAQACVSARYGYLAFGVALEADLAKSVAAACGPSLWTWLVEPTRRPSFWTPAVEHHIKNIVYMGGWQQSVG